jgi:hypothetical protein
MPARAAAAARIDRDAQTNTHRERKNKFSQNPASNSARDLLLRQDEHRDKKELIKRPIPGGAILPDGGGDAIPNADAGGTPD